MTSNYSAQRAIDFTDRWLEFNIKHRGLPGCAVAISHNKLLLLHKSYGKDIGSDQIFPIASQSKMFTATVIVKLATKGLLALDDPIIRYLSWIKQHPDSKIHAITIKQLLWHGSGLLRDGTNADFWQLYGDFPNVAELKNAILAANQVSPGGQKTKYSDLGYALLGQIITELTHKSYAAAVQELITKPLGMHNTYASKPPSAKQLCIGYTRPINGRRLKAPVYIQTKTFMPATGIYSTVGDLLLFMHAQFAGKDGFLTKQEAQLLHRGCRGHWVPSVDRDTDFGLGFMNYDAATGPIVGHSGAFLGHRSCSFTDKSSGLSVVLMFNAKDAPLIDAMFGIYHIWQYFSVNADSKTNPAIARYNTRLSALWGDREIVATNKQIVNVYLDEWQPFDAPEQLEIVDDTTLRITHTSDLMSENELVHLVFNNNKIVQAQYAGTTLWQPQKYYEWIKHNWPER